MPQFLTASRYLVVVAIAGCLLAAAALFTYGLLAVVRVVWATIAADIAVFGQGETDVVAVAEHLAVDLIQSPTPHNPTRPRSSPRLRPGP